MRVQETICVVNKTTHSNRTVVEYYHSTMTTCSINHQDMFILLPYGSINSNEKHALPSIDVHTV